MEKETNHIWDFWKTCRKQISGQPFEEILGLLSQNLVLILLKMLIPTTSHTLLCLRRRNGGFPLSKNAWKWGLVGLRVILLKRRYLQLLILFQFNLKLGSQTKTQVPYLFLYIAFMHWGNNTWCIDCYFLYLVMTF